MASRHKLGPRSSFELFVFLERGNMDISRKTDYALRMLAMLAEEPERLLSVRTAAEEVNVPYSLFVRFSTAWFRPALWRACVVFMAACALR